MYAIEYVSSSIASSFEKSQVLYAGWPFLFRIGWPFFIFGWALAFNASIAIFA